MKFLEACLLVTLAEAIFQVEASDIAAKINRSLARMGRELLKTPLNLFTRRNHSVKGRGRRISDYCSYQTVAREAARHSLIRSLNLMELVYGSPPQINVNPPFSFLPHHPAASPSRPLLHRYYCRPLNLRASLAPGPHPTDCTLVSLLFRTRDSRC